MLPVLQVLVAKRKAGKGKGQPLGPPKKQNPETPPKDIVVGWSRWPDEKRKGTEVSQGTN